MNAASEKSKSLPGIAALFDDMERKDIFRKYLYFLGWVELGILLTCWLYQIGDRRARLSPSSHGGYTFSSLSWPPSRSLSFWGPSLPVSTGISPNRSKPGRTSRNAKLLKTLEPAGSNS